ncbi:hypothetical protein TSH100_04075 [Azospirillum sp. TSH100]|uniref:hypothetical protein n=1 Tax=Azospirillum sp. TSH100 TaxID=652764 RepID=UPI000D603A6A|nr:hypothetical protein [Azospirillum sp. TSH100]PWC89823.1 hypothetical protein TSH100_04075 [Azospirillum sp. TSH100]QCG92301.1 hypothetical protein E6C72_31330 [Azospirillum sp. TSH100]
MVDLTRHTEDLGASFGALPFDTHNSKQAAVDAAVALTVSTMPRWYSQLHGLAAELAFWACVLVAIGRAIWFAVELVQRLRTGRKAAGSSAGER